jgi:hypothetical protein
MHVGGNALVCSDLNAQQTTAPVPVFNWKCSKAACSVQVGLCRLFENKAQLFYCNILSSVRSGATAEANLSASVADPGC